MKQEMNRYTQGDLDVWQTLFLRQTKQLEQYACQSYLDLLYMMSPVLNKNEIINFSNMNSWFKQQTGWQIQVVPGLIPVEEFFELLAQKKFCSSTWLRKPENLDYLEEPDMFHDIFGHVPLLSQPVFSDFMVEFGRLGVRYRNNERIITALKRLYWFTVEFGMIQEESLKIYGAGIISSYAETQIAVSDKAIHHQFDMKQIMDLDFRTDSVQKEYFAIESFEQLFQSLKEVEMIIPG